MFSDLQGRLKIILCVSKKFSYLPTLFQQSEYKFYVDYIDLQEQPKIILFKLEKIFWLSSSISKVRIPRVFPNISLPDIWHRCSMSLVIMSLGTNLLLSWTSGVSITSGTYHFFIKSLWTMSLLGTSSLFGNLVLFDLPKFSLWSISLKSLMGVSLHDSFQHYLFWVTSTRIQFVSALRLSAVP